MRILVTGGTGLVGRGIQRAIQNDPDTNSGNHVWIFVGSRDADLTYVLFYTLLYLLLTVWGFKICTRISKLLYRDLVATKALFDLHKPTHVIHLAAKVGGLYHNMSNNLDFLVSASVFFEHAERTQSFQLSLIMYSN